MSDIPAFKMRVNEFIPRGVIFMHPDDFVIIKRAFDEYESRQIVKLVFGAEEHVKALNSTERTTQKREG